MELGKNILPWIMAVIRHEYKWDEVGWESKFSSYRADVHYDQFDPLPMVFTFDNNPMEWKVTKMLP